MSSNNSLNTSVEDPEQKTNITWDRIVLGIILFLIIAVTIVGNILVLLAVKIEKKLQTTFNYYIVNLAITDVSVAVLAMSFQAIYIVVGYWPFGEVLCAVWIFFDYGMTFVSVFTLIMISLDRFWSVTWSVHYRTWHTKRKCLISILSIWLFMLILWVPPWITDRIRYSHPDICYWDPSLNKEFVFIVATLGHHGPYLIMIFCYTYVFIFMHKRTKVGNIAQVNTKSSYSNPRSSARTESDTSSSPKASTAAEQTSASKDTVNLTSKDTVTTISQNTRPAFLTVPQDNKASVDRSETNSSQGTTHRKTYIGRERRVFITLTYIIIGYAILWLPFHVVFDISIVDPTFVPESVLNMAFWMAYFNSTINPFLYNFSSAEFRKAFRRLLIRR